MLSLDGEYSERIHVSQTTRCFVDTVESTHSDRDAHTKIAQQVGLIMPPIEMLRSGEAWGARTGGGVRLHSFAEPGDAGLPRVHLG